MTAPYTPQIHPQVIQGNVAPDPIAILLQSLAQGAQIGVRGYEEQQANSRSSAELAFRGKELDVRKQELALAQERERTQQAQTEAQGKAFLELLKQNPYASLAMGQQGAATQATPQSVPQGEIPQATMQTPAAPIPGGGMPQPYNPVASLSAAVQGIAPQYIPGVLQAIQPVATQIEGYQKKVYETQQIAQAIASAPPEKQGALRAMYSFAMNGDKLDPKVAQNIWPELYTGNNPDNLARFSTIFQTGVPTAGQAARMAGVTLPSGWDPNSKYIAPSLQIMRQGLGAYRQGQAANYLTEMTAANSILNPIEDKWTQAGTSIGFMGGVLKHGLASPSTNLWGELKQYVARNVVDEDEQRYANAAVDFAQGWAHSTSGLRLTNEQSALLLRTTTAEAGDSPEIRNQKRRMRQMMITGQADIAKGVRTPQQVVEEMAKLKWDPLIQNSLNQQLQATKAEQAARLKGGGSITGSEPVDPSNLSQVMGALYLSLQAATANQSPQP